MNYMLLLTPAGHLILRESDNDEVVAFDSWMKRVVAGFAGGGPAGLFALAAVKPDSPPPVSFIFWRYFAGKYLTELCRPPELAGDAIPSVELPTPGELATMLLSIPPSGLER